MEHLLAPGFARSQRALTVSARARTAAPALVIVRAHLFTPARGAAFRTDVTLPWAALLALLVALSCSLAMRGMILFAFASVALTAFVTSLAVSRSSPLPAPRFSDRYRGSV